MSICIDTPISWLRLERHALGEGSADERGRIGAHLSSCAACRSVADSIAGDPVELLPLPRKVGPKAGSAPSWRASTRDALSLTRWIAGPTLAAMAATALLAIVPGAGIKGGVTHFDLVVRRGEAIIEAPPQLALGDAIKVRVSAPPGDRELVVVVIQDGERSVALDPHRSRGGNDELLPGAFRLDSTSPATICLLVDPPSRDAAVDPALCREFRYE